MSELPRRDRQPRKNAGEQDAGTRPGSVDPRQGQTPRPRPQPVVAPRVNPPITPRADRREIADGNRPPAGADEKPKPARPIPMPKARKPEVRSPIPSDRTSTRVVAGRLPAPTSTGHKPAALITRGERTLFLILLASVLAMSWYVLRFRARTEAHFQSRAMPVPLASAAGVTVPVLLTLANDETGALTTRSLAFLLPEDPNTRARVVLQKLLAEYAAPGSAHPLPALAPGVESVAEVFLSPAPGERGLLATVDLTSSFVHLHPSGIEPETLTLLSMIGTLHANLPQVSEVRFLVDGEPRPTLAGHADLLETYLAGQTAPSEAFTTR